MIVPTLRNLRIRLRESLWFVPGAVLTAFIAAAFLLLQLDRLAGKVLDVSAEGARAILATIAGSLMTVAGVTFSITIVAISLAANQYSPRVLRNFSRDRTNQLTLGFFAGVFAYCIVVLGAVHGGDDAFVPSVSVLVAILLSITAVGVFIYFIHHTAVSVESSHIVSAVAEETVANVREIFPEHCCKDPERRPIPGDDQGGWTPIPSSRTGYLQTVDIGGLRVYASDHGIVVRLACSVGDFIARGETIAEFRGKGAGELDGAADSINHQIEIGHYRTIAQDVSFGVRQIVDVSLKALSPAINDTGTGLMCIDFLSSILLAAAAREDPACEHFEGDVLCLITREVSFERLLAEAFDSIRRNAEENAEVLMRILQALARIAPLTSERERRRAILDQIGLIRDAADRGISAPRDLRRVHQVATALVESLA